MTLFMGFLAGVISFVIGGLWYGLFFREVFMKAVGITAEMRDESIAKGDNGQKEMMFSAVFEISFAIVTVFFLKNLGISPLYAAVMMGLLAALSSIKNYLFVKSPIQLIVLNESYKVICYLVVGICALFA